MMGENKILKIRNIRDIQGQKEIWSIDNYMCGYYNGIELCLAILENREPEFKEMEKEYVE
jgi:hypothetical protein